LKYSLYWIYKLKKYDYIYVINSNDDITEVFDKIYNFNFYTDKFKKEKKLLYPINNYFIDIKCLKILLLSLDKIEINNKNISKLFREYKIYLNKINSKDNNFIEQKKKNFLYLILFLDKKK